MPAGVETPLTALVNSLLHPLLATATLVVCVYAYGEHFTGHYLILTVLTFFISSQVFDEIDILVPWSSFHLTRLIRGIVVGWAIVAAILLFLGYATQLTGNFEQEVILTWFAATPVVLLAGTKVARSLVRRAVVSGVIARSAVVVGANELGRELAARLRRDLYSGISVRGYFDDRKSERLAGLDPAEVLGKVADAPDFVKRNGIDCVYIALPIAAQPRIIALINALRDSTASVYFVPHLFVFDLIQARVDSISGIPVVAVCETPIFGVNAVVKRVFDLAMASLILAAIWPLMMVIAAGVKLSSPGPALFKQRRYGLGGEEIMVYKFRTMTVQEDGPMVVQASKQDKRVTRYGAFLRRTSLDELPQFFNVLGGSMSIVGPRPHAIAHNEQYRKLIDGYMIRHKVKPGITGWAQVNGFRGETQTVDKMRKRIEYDLDYLRNWSVSLDMWIMVKTLVTVLRDRNAY
ncbi:MAG: undecaprenyl-phosphate glucose phosphotransferase [Burkholderiales bacterium]|nr:undecaprenyl-phosphate glucose phosphotransferase [Burkholderiales bacterium]